MHVLLRNCCFEFDPNCKTILTVTQDKANIRAPLCREVQAGSCRYVKAGTCRPVVISDMLSGAAFKTS